MREAEGPWALLGAIRFALALVVVGTHLEWFAPGLISQILASFSGLAAVLGFLVISGYSIAHSICRRPEGYYRRRLLRIMPLYSLAIVCAYIVGSQSLTTVTGATFPATSIGELANIVFWQLISGHSISTDAVVWTLAVEAAFYALAPVLVKARPAVILIGIGVSVITFIAYRHSGGTYYSAVGGGLNIVLFAWAWLLGFWFYRAEAGRPATVLLMSIPIVACYYGGFPLAPLWGPTLIITSLAIAKGGIIRLSSRVETICEFLGDISYPLYLLHLPTLIFCTRIGIGSVAALLPATLLTALLAHKLDGKKRLIFRPRATAIA
jgi:peptidoglycan/LPS O-acetylase OafA/YrhL